MNDNIDMTVYSANRADSDSIVDWKNPPKLKDLKEDLNQARTSHNTHIERVNEWIDALNGKTDFKKREGRSNIQPKLIRKQNEWRYSSLEEPFLSTDDMFIVNPVTHNDIESARQNMLILNKQFRVDIPKVEFINKFIRTAVNTGTVVIKLSWETITDIVREEVEEPVFTQTPEETLAFLQQAIANGEIAEEEAIAIFESGEPIQIGVEMVPTEVEKDIVNRPILQIRDHRRIIIDPSCEGNIHNAKFIIDEFLTDLSSLKEDGRYINLDKINYENAGTTIDNYVTSNTTDNEPQFKFHDKARKKLVAFEYWGYWDINDDGIVKPFVATWIGDTLIRLDENPYPDKKLPFVIVPYIPMTANSVYGEADAALLKENQDIIGAITRSVIDLIGRSANAQQGVRKDLLDPLNRTAFNEGRNFEYNPINGDIQNALYVTKMPEIPRSALELLQLQNNEAEALTGVKAFTGGISGDSLGNSVGGIRTALDATAKRELSIIRRLSNGLIEIGKKIIAMNSVWLSDEEIIRITDDEFVAIPRSDLAGTFDLSLKVSTAEADNQKASELAFMLQTVGNSMPFEMSQLVLTKIAELRKIPDLAMAIKQYQPQPDPQTEQIKALQIQLLEAQVENEYAKAAENRMDEVLKGARAENELAKAGKTTTEAQKIVAETSKINSEKDKLDLDFVEQSTGISHKRDLENKAFGNKLKDRNNPNTGLSDFSVDLL